MGAMQGPAPHTQPDMGRCPTHPRQVFGVVFPCRLGEKLTANQARALTQYHTIDYAIVGKTIYYPHKLVGEGGGESKLKRSTNSNL